MHNALLPRDTTHKQHVGHIRVDAMMAQHLWLADLHILIQVNAIVDHMQLARIDIEKALHIHLRFLRHGNHRVRHLNGRALQPDREIITAAQLLTFPGRRGSR